MGGLEAHEGERGGSGEVAASKARCEALGIAAQDESILAHATRVDALRAEMKRFRRLVAESGATYHGVAASLAIADLDNLIEAFGHD